LQPDPRRTSLSAETQRLLGRLLESDWETAAGIALTDSQLEELRLFLHGYIIYHLGRIPKGRALPRSAGAARTQEGG